MAPGESLSARSPTQCHRSHVCPRAAEDMGQAAGEGWAGTLQAWHISPQGTGHRAQTASTATGKVAVHTSAAGWLRRSCLRAPLSLQALHRAAAAQLPPALRVLYGDGGAPLHVRLRILPGQRLGHLRCWHACRRQLRARAPLCHWQCPQEEAAPPAAGPGKPRGRGRALRCPTAVCCRALSPVLPPRAGSLGEHLVEQEVGMLLRPCTSQESWPATSVLQCVVPHRAMLCRTVPFSTVPYGAVLYRALTPLPCSHGSG